MIFLKIKKIKKKKFKNIFQNNFNKRIIIKKTKDVQKKKKKKIKT